jgi:hypothetical protein
MALTDDNSNGSGFVMPVAPMYGNGGQGGFGNCFGGDGWWILLLFILLGNGGWGNGFGGFGGNGFAADSAAMYPWMNQSNQIHDGFRDQMMNSSIQGVQNSITSGFGDVQTSLCNGFAGVNATINSGFAGAEASANARQMANMNQAFAAQTAMAQGFNGLQAQFADCCCENRLANCQTQNVIQSEGSQTRFADANNTRDIIENQTRGTQAILDKLCALELDGVKGQLAQAQRENVALQNQVNMAAFRESQANQNALFAQGMNNEVDALYNRLKNCPVGTTPVYGNQPIFTCGGNNGCGCGCGM